MTTNALGLAASNLSVAFATAGIPWLVAEHVAPYTRTEDIVCTELTVTVEIISDRGSGTSKMDRHVIIGS